MKKFPSNGNELEKATLPKAGHKRKKALEKAKKDRYGKKKR
nr:MAG TPA: hypothetical protein [Caudoviricetes sp.]